MNNLELEAVEHQAELEWERSIEAREYCELCDAIVAKHGAEVLEYYFADVVTFDDDLNIVPSQTDFDFIIEDGGDIPF